MTLVALSASYGAGGSFVGPKVAEALGVPFLDRAIPLAVAEHLGVPVDDASAHDGQMAGNRLERMLRGFLGGDTGAPMPLPSEDMLSSEDFRQATEDVLLRQAASGAGVILGRGAVMVLREDPRVLRVRLDGPEPARVALAVRLGRIDVAVAERAQRQLDRMHADYARHFYGVEVTDPALYHLMIDSTAIPLEACVQVIARTARAFAATGVPLSA
jgi:hypothetical protein